MEDRGREWWKKAEAEAKGWREWRKKAETEAKGWREWRRASEEAQAALTALIEKGLGRADASTDREGQP